MFKESFKYYKSKLPPPDFDDVVDFKRIDSFRNKVKKVEPLQVRDNEFPLLLRPASEWNVFELVDSPGLLFVENPWTEAGIRYWVSRCLLQLTRTPSKLNIAGEVVSGGAQEGGWWQEAQNRLTHDNGALLRRLRWATFGYHHDWDTKEYSEQNKCAFPVDLAAVCRYVAETVGGWSEFAAQAAILNFYHRDSTLSGHCDHSEPNMAAPLLSFSFGQSAIFLVGGLSLEEKPTAVFIDNGDVMIMSAASRHVYHAVPRIVTSRWVPKRDSITPNSTPAVQDSLVNCDPCQVNRDSRHVNRDSCEQNRDSRQLSHLNNDSCQLNCDSCEQNRDSRQLNHLNSDSYQLNIDSLMHSFTAHNASLNSDLLKSILSDDVTFWRPFADYVSQSRINMNVRQVLASGQTSLS